MPARSAPKRASPPQRPARVKSWSDGALTLGTFVVLAVMVFAVYGRAIHAPFIFDDLPGIVENPSIVRLWPPFGDADTPGPLSPPRLGPTDRRPLPNLTFALNYHFGRLEPTGYHVVNLVVHVLVAAMLAALVRRTLRLPYFEGRWDRAAWPLSFAVALVWALHPLGTDAVAYAIQRTELMVALFYLTTLWAALRYWTASSAQARRAWLIAATLACLAGMASKEIMIFAPLVVLLFEWTFLVRSAREMRRSWPLYACLTLGWALLFLLTQSKTHGVTYDARHAVPLYVWWFTQAKVLFLYLKLAFWPWPLSIHYGTPFVRTFTAASPWLAAVAILVIATLLLLWRRSAVGFVVAAMGLILAPTSLVPILQGRRRRTPHVLAVGRTGHARDRRRLSADLRPLAAFEPTAFRRRGDDRRRGRGRRLRASARRLRNGGEHLGGRGRAPARRFDGALQSRHRARRRSPTSRPNREIDCPATVLWAQYILVRRSAASAGWRIGRQAAGIKEVYCLRTLWRSRPGCKPPPLGIKKLDELALSTCPIIPVSWRSTISRFRQDF